MEKRSRGRPRKEILFFADPEANKKWNAERGKGTFRKSRYPNRMGSKRLKEQLCASWGVPVTVSFEFVCRLEYHQDDMPPELTRELEAVIEAAKVLRNNGGSARRLAALNEYKLLMSVPKVRDLVQKVAERRMSARQAAQRLHANWTAWRLMGETPSERKLREWMGKEAKIMGRTSR